ncbi:MAG: FAD-dependent 5-carboxymethylaminomethyl-2-thiouridine(34) oxidoreductase MnmC [Alysiella sp.]|uniref:FAD-dependent 5-carboxymethylaminomethyl-2-thiouridine(34) oxidoreductase MnmC n=1 Tax=Alysiella sp. TaxID=1872483 RepID=UPI0026DACD59|nr:FAD-dependent 5-carboxymethylaminomethyl-2-thiouridine(34) oxidoreductase MnmC [Alysiella sp.]MDO4434550.1 FAD-dependent 5-carboxymethylaminomethyl-2-thiouridine(34) oxidoreductase MnmC [Alysiella sp.]
MTAKPVYAWSQIPSFAELSDFVQHHDEDKILLMMLPEKHLPEFSAAQTVLFPELVMAWQRALKCVQFQTANVIADFLPNCELWLLPESRMMCLHEHFRQPIQWQNTIIPQKQPEPIKAWFRLPENNLKDKIPQVLIVGAGIAGAATAYELAKRGAKVCVLEANSAPAQAASGNRQGLLYAKISPHATAQTELLLLGYGYTHRLLEYLQPEQKTWQTCGVLHLNHNTSETQRNRDLAKQTWHCHLYHYLNAQQATQLAGIDVKQDGLFWPQGAWLNPTALITQLLNHPNISLHTHAKLTQAEFTEHQWQVITTDQRQFSGSHIVFCTGSNNPATPIICDFPFQMIRGQTSLIAANLFSQQLKIALSGSSYISPAWDNVHCYGATFINNDNNSQWREADEMSNRQALQTLNSILAQNLLSQPFSDSLKGHAAVRCDSHDHLPVVGALGDVAVMHQVYAKLALDKNYRLNTTCPYLPNAYTNTAHGSRGLATAPICAAEIAAQICGTAMPFSEKLRQALSPNRLIIRQIVRTQSSSQTNKTA